jgi:hypothetical protein
MSSVRSRLLGPIGTRRRPNAGVVLDVLLEIGYELRSRGRGGPRPLRPGRRSARTGMKVLPRETFVELCRSLCEMEAGRADGK